MQWEKVKPSVRNWHGLPPEPGESPLGIFTNHPDTILGTGLSETLPERGGWGS